MLRVWDTEAGCNPPSRPFSQPSPKISLTAHCPPQGTEVQIRGVLSAAATLIPELRPRATRTLRMQRVLAVPSADPTPHSHPGAQALARRLSRLPSRPWVPGIPKQGTAAISFARSLARSHSFVSQDLGVEKRFVLWEERGGGEGTFAPLSPGPRSKGAVAAGIRGGLCAGGLGSLGWWHAGGAHCITSVDRRHPCT